MRHNKMSDATRTRISMARATILVVVLCLPYVVSQFLRSSVGVIAPNLIDELRLDPAELGLLVSVFFLSFAFAQIPLGAAIDRFGPKICLLSSVAIAFLGCLLFAWAQTPFGLMVARLIMGLGCATFFMAPLTIYTRWFSLAMFSSLTGITLGIGTLGTLVATAPMAAAVAWIGWRAVFVYVGLAIFFFAIIILFVVRDSPPGQRCTPIVRNRS
ncbi:MAG: MFS transporter [Fimbriimonadaceae bacterium]|nr:MFS transporter [Alphaproteobacteria bacterium]